MVVFPVTQPMNQNGLVEWNVWIPPGNWVEWFTGTTFTGPLVVTRSCALTDIPAYVRAGAIIPLVDFVDRPLTGGAKLIPGTLTLRVFACAGCSGSTEVYEDDGDTTLYQTDSTSNYAWTPVKWAANGNNIVVMVSPPEGNFTGFPTQRNFRVKVQGTYGPAQVAVNGASVPFDVTRTAVPSWSYDGDNLAVEVITPIAPIATAVTVNVTSAAPLDANLYSGIPLAINRLYQVKQMLDDQFPSVYQEDYKAVTYGASTGLRMTEYPATSMLEVANFTNLFNSALAQVKALQGLNSTYQSQVVAMLATAAPLSSIEFTIPVISHKPAIHIN